MRIIGIMGCGGFGREILPNVKKDKETEIIFIDEDNTKTNINGIDVISPDDFINYKKNHNKFFNISIANSKTREKFSRFFIENEITPIDIISDKAVIDDFSEIAEGCVLCEFSVIKSNVKVGKYFHADRSSNISHDCVIGDFVTFAPHVNCNGNVQISNYVYIGTGAVIKNGTSDKPLTIGEGAVVGMGAVVIRDVKPYTTVAGNPAKILNIKD